MFVNVEGESYIHTYTYTHTHAQIRTSSPLKSLQLPSGTITVAVRVFDQYDSASTITEDTLVIDSSGSGSSRGRQMSAAADRLLFEKVWANMDVYVKAYRYVVCCV